MNLPVKIDTWWDKTGFKTALGSTLFSPDKITSVSVEISVEMTIWSHTFQSWQLYCWSAALWGGLFCRFLLRFTHFMFYHRQNYLWPNTNKNKLSAFSKKTGLLTAVSAGSHKYMQKLGVFASVCLECDYKIINEQKPGHLIDYVVQNETRECFSINIQGYFGFPLAPGEVRRVKNLSGPAKAFWSGSLLISPTPPPRH